MKQLNYELGPKRTNVGVAMEEGLNDAVNASGIAAVMVGFAARTQEVEVPAVDTKLIPPEVLQELMAAKKLPMKKTFNLTDKRFFVKRISPKDLLTPSDFTGSNFDDASWIGYSGTCSWSEAKNEWRLSDEEKDQIVNGGNQNTTLQLKLVTTDSTTDQMTEEEVYFDRAFYWRYRFDPQEPHFCSIWEVVKVAGREKPVVHEQWKGQQYSEETGQYVGNLRFPIRVLTLTYISDNPIPPSDTEAGRPQVQDLRRSRSQMFMNRRYSVPMRWHNVNVLDPLVQEQIMRGVWQGSVPVNGDGARAMGELARASYPAEDFSFDRTTKSDLQETYQIGPNQMGSVTTGDHTKYETQNVQANFATRMGQERNAVARFFLSIAETLAGWMVLYSDFSLLSQQERQTMERAWNHKTLLLDLVLEILPDSTVVLDTNSKLDRIEKFVNLWGKSGYANLKSLAVKHAMLLGQDPAEAIVDPQPPKPEDPNISYRFSGKDDMMNPMVLGILHKRQELPSAEELKQVIELLKTANELALAVQAPVPNPQGASDVLPPTAGGPADLPNGSAAEDMHPDWNLMPTVAKRQRDV
jgi:hypothetical protein